MVLYFFTPLGRCSSQAVGYRHASVDGAALTPLKVKTKHSLFKNERHGCVAAFIIG